MLDVVLTVLLAICFMGLICLIIFEFMGKKHTKTKDIVLIKILFDGTLIESEIVAKNKSTTYFKFEYEGEVFIFSHKDAEFYQLQGSRNWSSIKIYDV